MYDDQANLFFALNFMNYLHTTACASRNVLRACQIEERKVILRLS